MKTKTAMAADTTTSKPYKSKLKKRKSGRLVTPTRTLRTRDGTPLRAKVTIVSENEMNSTEEVTGFVSVDPGIFGQNVVLTKEIDGFPWIELPQEVISRIEYINPNEEVKIYPVPNHREAGGD
jgi:hypothetical protein